VERTGAHLSPAARGIEAVDAAGRIHGMVVCDLWTASAAHMHVALDSAAATRSLVVPAFEWLFQQGGRSLAIGVVRGRNSRSLHFAQRLGFREAYRIRNGWAEGEDMVLLEMRKQDCRWLGANLQRKAA
jgi:hypothetical protein